MIGFSELILTALVFFLINNPDDFKLYYQKFLQFKKSLLDTKDEMTKKLLEVQDEITEIKKDIIIGDDGKEYECYKGLKNTEEKKE